MELVFQNLTKDKKYNSSFFEGILNTAMEELNLNKKLGISINLVGEEKIKELNKKYRNKDKVTDVLSFPMSEDGKLDQDIGDLFICLSFAKKEAKGENITIDFKLAQLTVHGFLHLLGYDHERSEKDSSKMLRMEDKILKNLSTENSNFN